MLHKLFDPTPKEGAQAIQSIGPDIGPVVISHLRKRHPIEASGFRKLLDGHASALPELQVSDALLKLKS